MPSNLTRYAVIFIVGCLCGMQLKLDLSSLKVNHTIDSWQRKAAEGFSETIVDFQRQFMTVPTYNPSLENVSSVASFYVGKPRPRHTSKKLLARYDRFSGEWLMEESSILPIGITPTKPLLGFIRVQKTGSTTVIASMLTNETGPTFGCFRGRLDAKEDYPRELAEKNVECGHLSRFILRQNWQEEKLPLMFPDAGKATSDSYSTLQFFSMVREPVDRIISLYQYIQPRVSWQRMLSKEQLRYMEEDRILDWTESMWKSTKTIASGVPYQFQLFNRTHPMDPTFAISMVQGDEPEVLTLVNECFDASLLLLLERFPEYIDSQAVDAFLNKTNDEKLMNRKKQKFIDKEAKMREDLQELRERAREWGWREYKFYDATVEQFRIHLEKSSIHPTIVEECFMKLDELKPKEGRDAQSIDEFFDGGFHAQQNSGSPKVVAQFDPAQEKWLSKFVENTTTVIETGTPILGFLRIHGTGAFSMLGQILTTETGPTLGCFRGRFNDRNDYPAEFSQESEVCRLLSVNGLSQQWRELLPSMSPTDASTTQNGSPSLQLFSIVRDPFDRLLSAFHILKRTAGWHRSQTPEQLEYLDQNLFWNWTESHYKRTNPGRNGFPYQFHFFDRSNWEDPTEAISMIRGDQPRVLALINECYDASLLLLLERFPEFIDPQTVLDFLNLNEEYKRVNRKRRKDAIDDEEHKESLERLRELSKEWGGWRDYQFYDAAVEQFRIHLKKSSVHPSIVEECFQTLDGLNGRKVDSDGERPTDANERSPNGANNETEIDIDGQGLQEEEADGEMEDD